MARVEFDSKTLLDIALRIGGEKGPQDAMAFQLVSEIERVESTSA